MSKTKISWQAVSATAFIIFLAMNLLTPNLTDDYAYSFIWDGEHGGNVADGGPAVLEGDGYIAGNEAGEHERTNDYHKDEGNLQQVFECSSEVGHASSLIISSDTKKWSSGMR